MRLPNFLRSDTPAAVGSLCASSANPDNASEQSSWRKPGGASSRNLKGFQHQDMVRQCSKSATVDGLSRAHVRLLRSITVGAQEIGVEVRCADTAAREKLQELVDIGWKHPANDLGKALGTLMDGATVTGSLALTLCTDEDPATGTGSMLTTLGYLDPETFVEPGVLADPGNARDPIAVLRSGWLATGPQTVAHPIVRNDDTVHKLFRGGDGKPLPVGSTLTIPRRSSFGGELVVAVGEPCAYWGINCVSPSQTLGVSDLYAGLDLMGALDELVHGSVERSVGLGAYSFHVKFPRGTSQEVIKKTMDAIRADVESGRGRAVGTTEDISIAAIFASLQAGEWAAMEKMARTSALIALGPWPAHMMSDGGATNVATAAEQGSPVANFLLDRQNAFRKYILGIVWYMLRRYPEARRLLDANPDVDLCLSLPVIVAKDTTRESNVLQVETTTLLAAVTAGLITLEAAQEEWRESANRYGFHIEPEDAPSPEAIAAEKAASALTLPPMQVGADPNAQPAAEPPPPTKSSEGTPPGKRKAGR